MNLAATFDPSAAASGSFPAQFPNGSGKMVVYNESSVSILLQWPGMQTYCPAWTAMLYCVQSPQALVTWQQQYILPVAGGGSPLSVVIVEAYGDNEPILGTYPAPLVRQASISNNLNIGTSVATVQNDNNATNTTFLEATVSGQGSSTFQGKNQGEIILGNGSVPGQLNIVSQAPNSGAYSDVIELGNGSQIGIFGSASVDLQLLSNGIIAIKIGGVQILHIGSTGLAFDSAGNSVIFNSLGGNSVVMDWRNNTDLILNCPNAGGNRHIYFEVGGVHVASLDSSGNLIIKGALTQNGAP